MRPIEDLLPRVLEKAVTCPEPTALGKLRDAGREFLRRTRLWREMDSFTVDAETCEALSTPADASVFEIVYAGFLAEDAEDDDVPLQLTPISIADLDAEHDGWRVRAGTPCFFTQGGIDALRLVPKAAGTLKIEQILIPSERAQRFPDFLVDRFGKEIAEGALGEVLAIPGPFYDAIGAAAARQRFETYLGYHASLASRGLQRSKRRSRTQSFF